MTQNTEVSTAPPPALIAIDPQTYVGQVYKPHRDRFTAIAAEATLLDYDAATPAGMRIGIERRAMLRDVRLDVEKTRKQFKAPLLDAGKLLDQRAKEITAEIEPLEDAHDARIKAVEAAKEAEKQARILADQQRVAAIHARIAELQTGRGMNANCHAATIAMLISELEAAPVTVEEFAELTGMAQMAKDETLAKLAEFHAAAVRREALEAEEKAGREAEAARLRAEQEAAAASLKAAQEELKRQQAAAAERDRVAAAERAQADAEAKAAREAAEKEQQAQKAAHEAEMQAERAKLQAELAVEREASAKRQAELDRQAQALADAAAKVERERLDREAAESARQAAEAKRTADAEAAEAQRVADEKAKVEQAARETAQAEARRLAEIKAMRRPADFALAATIASAYRCDHEEAIEWLSGFSANGARNGLQQLKDA